MTDSKTAIGNLIKVMNTTTNALALRVAAAEGLGYAGGDDARSALGKVMNTTTTGLELRVAAARALGHAAKS